jgi:hypothetical protein
MNATKRAAWEKVQARGRDRFLLRKIGRAAWIGAILFGGLHVVLVLFGKRPIVPPWDVIAEWAFMSLFVGGVFGNSEWQEKEEDFRESDAESEKH